MIDRLRTVWTHAATAPQTAILRAPLTRWALALGWTALTLALMLSPSGDGTTVTGLSDSFGGTDLGDAGGHVIILAILSLLWCWTASLYGDTATTTRRVLIAASAWGLAIELAQSLTPGRETALLDACANLLGVLIGMAIYRGLVRLLDRPTAP